MSVCMRERKNRRVPLSVFCLQYYFPSIYTWGQLGQMPCIIKFNDWDVKHELQNLCLPQEGGNNCVCLFKQDEHTSDE